MLLNDTDVILFQGDSITDADRNREQEKPNNLAGLGRGYAFLAAGLLHEAFPAGKLQIHNRGVSGNRVTNLENRWQKDALDVNPDVLSIMIGVNDTWHGTAKGTPENGVPLGKFEEVLRKILTRSREHNPDLRLVLCEPFVLPCGAVNEAWFPEFTERRAIVKKLAGEFDAVFVAFQAMFDEALNRAAAEDWAGDGVHPSFGGHMLMAKTWFDAVSNT